MVDVIAAETAMNKWWQRRTSSGVDVAWPETSAGMVRVEPGALFVVVEYARNMSALAESRRKKLAELQRDVATLQEALLNAGRENRATIEDQPTAGG